MAARGDEEAFARLYSRHRDWAFRLALRFTRNADDASDVVQEAFAYVFRKVPSLTLTARFTTFLYPVVRSVSFTILRKKRATEIPPESMEDLVLAPPEPPRPDLQGLAGVLAMLPAGQREVLEMRFVRSMTMEQIALALRIPTGTVKSRMHNAIKALRENPETRAYFLGESPPPPEPGAGEERSTRGTGS